MGTYALTGSASGIGAHLKASLEEDGHDVLTVDLKDADITTDLATAEGRTLAAEELVKLAPSGLDGFVPLAGVAAQPGKGRLITSLNFYGTVALVEALRDAVARKQGSIVLLCSNSAPMAPHEAPLIDTLLTADEAAALEVGDQNDDGLHYMAGKRALAYWMRRNALPYARAGVRMNAVAPGPIDTPMTKPLFENEVMANIMQGLIDATPIPRMGNTSEVVNTIRFLLSADASYICGSVLFVDGGYDAATRPDHI